MASGQQVDVVLVLRFGLEKFLGDSERLTVVLKAFVGSRGASNQKSRQEIVVC